LFRFGEFGEAQISQQAPMPGARQPVRQWKDRVRFDGEISIRGGDEPALADSDDVMDESALSFRGPYMFDYRVRKCQVEAAVAERQPAAGLPGNEFHPRIHGAYPAGVFDAGGGYPLPERVERFEEIGFRATAVPGNADVDDFVARAGLEGFHETAQDLAPGAQ